MNWKNLRTEFLKYFETNQHKIVESSSLIPAQDNSILFANAGMNQFKDVFLGVQSRPYSRATTIQKCVRAGGKHNDLDQVGFTKRHCTFFEMMGNFSFGDYFKEEAIFFAWDFLTRVVGLDKERLSVTVHTSDMESKNIWMEKIGVPESKIRMLGDADNFWQMGDTGPCGPCTEIYFDRGPIENCTEDDRIIEIWNLVFMQFDKQADGTLKKLVKTGVDTGMGFERLVAVFEGKETIFQTELFKPIMQAIESATGISYRSSNAKTQAAFNVLADHIRSSCFLIADGAKPSNEGRGYVLRKIMRRALLFSQKLSPKQDLFENLVKTMVQAYQEFYPYLTELEDEIKKIIASESEKFFGNLQRGQKLFLKIVQECKDQNKTLISGQDAFKLYDTYGFPLEVTRVMAMELSIDIDIDGFEREMDAQKKRSNATQASQGQEFNLPEKLSTLFVGYDCLEQKSSVVWVSEKQDGWIALDKSPFFVATGGQVTDSGVVTINGVDYNVLEAIYVSTGENSKAGVIKLEGIEGISISLGQEVHAKVNAQNRANTARNHSATHLLHSALQNVLGKHAKQAGSLVHPDYLRFLFNHPKAMSAEEINKTESLVNQWIMENLSCQVCLTSLEKARELGAEAIFGEKYNPESVRIVNLGTISSELCGGTHVQQTGEIGAFKIISEGAVGTGIRSIIALSGTKALEYFQEINKIVKTLCTNFSAKPETLLEQINKEETKIKNLEAKIKELNELNTSFIAEKLINEHKATGKKTVLICTKINQECDLKLLSDKVVGAMDNCVIMLFKEVDQKCNFILNAGLEAKKSFSLQDLMQKIKYTGICGGGKAFIQGTFSLNNSSEVQKALSEIIQ